MPVEALFASSFAVAVCSPEYENAVTNAESLVRFLRNPNGLAEFCYFVDLPAEGKECVRVWVS